MGELLMDILYLFIIPMATRQKADNFRFLRDECSRILSATITVISWAIPVSSRRGVFFVLIFSSGNAEAVLKYIFVDCRKNFLCTGTTAAYLICG